jgi:GH24 family phage-related lysozyme (muramidase)
MNMDLTKQWITRWESTRYQSYDDANGQPLTPGITPKGNPTIGVGFNLVAAGAQAAIEALGLDFNSVLTGAVNITADQVDQLLTNSINLAIAGATTLVPSFNTLPDNQQMVLTDLVFNMGEHGLSKFVNTLNYINNQDWMNAAANLQLSAWFHQVGSGPNQRGGADTAVLGGTADPQAILGNA